MKVSVEWEGLESTLRTLQALPKDVVSKRGGPVRACLAKGARFIRDKAKSRLRAAIAMNGDVSTGLLEKNVVASRGKPLFNGNGERQLVRVRRKVYDNAKIGQREKAGKRVTTHKTASLLEYGSVHQRATPWLRPTVQQDSRQVIAMMAEDLNRRIEQTVKKLARQNRGR